jgi:2-polyprenyl-3-methyl-5-hydroxy-6-metoxy-1,4-benzoquinol methylase
VELIQRYYLKLAAAYVRGKLASQFTENSLFTTTLDELGESELEELYAIGKEHELKLHRFKISRELPRVAKVLGILKGFQPADLLDIGTGRGVFLWPFLDTFPYVPITCLDLLDYRVEDIMAVQKGGISQISARLLSITEADYPDGAFDGITFLETLEHIPETEKAIEAVCRIARRFIIISVPSKEDENPEHIHLFDQNKIKEVFARQGIHKVKFDYVLNHLIAVAVK